MTSTEELTVTRVPSADGTEIGYWTGGSGPPLLLVHGALGDHTRWAALRPHLEPHFTVHAMDRRGRGASGDSPDYDVDREFEDVAAVVEAVAVAAGSRVDVIGSSAGASFAIGAATLTTRVRRLVLFEPPTSALARFLPAGLHERLDGLLAAGDREGVLETAYRELAGLSDAEIDDLRARPSWPNRVAAAHTVPRELRVRPERFFDPDRAAGVTVPTLLLVGGATPEVFRASADAVAAAMPHAHVTVIEGQGHGAEMFAPALVADVMLRFLRDRS